MHPKTHALLSHPHRFRRFFRHRWCSGCHLSLPVAIPDSIPLSPLPFPAWHRPPLLRFPSPPPPPAASLLSSTSSDPLLGLAMFPTPPSDYSPTPSADIAVAASPFLSPSSTRSLSPLPLLEPPAATPIPLSSTSSRRLPPLIHLLLPLARACHVPYFCVCLFPLPLPVQWFPPLPSHRRPRSDPSLPSPSPSRCCPPPPRFSSSPHPPTASLLSSTSSCPPPGLIMFPTPLSTCSPTPTPDLRGLTRDLTTVLPPAIDGDPIS